MITFLHIPKTGCTSIKYALNEQPNESIEVYPRRGHNTHINKLHKNLALIIRDPWQRFCSGFWERKTTPQRKQISETQDVEKFGYPDYRPYEKTIIDQMSTPEEFFIWAQQDREAYRRTEILFEITQSMCHWVGTPAVFVQHEHKIKLAFDISDLTGVMRHRFGIEMPEDPFRKRSRALFDINQSYDISVENLAKFKQWRAHDYELIEYIKQQSYYLNDK